MKNVSILFLVLLINIGFAIGYTPPKNNLPNLVGPPDAVAGVNITVFGGGTPGCTWSTAWDVTAACTGVESNGVSVDQVRNVVNSADTTASGTKVRFTFEARSNASSANYVTTCVYFGERSSGDVMSSITEVTFNSGSSGFTISEDGGTIVSDEIDFSFNTANDYLVQIENNGTIQHRYFPDSGDTECYAYRRASAAATCTDVLDLASDGNYTAVYGLQKIEVCN
jgi:hypothetical protein